MGQFPAICTDITSTIYLGILYRQPGSIKSSSAPHIPSPIPTHSNECSFVENPLCDDKVLVFVCLYLYNFILFTAHIIQPGNH